MKKISILEKMMNTVSSFPWLKGTLEPFVKVKTLNSFTEQPFFNDVAGILSNLTVEEFEKLIHKIFKQRGYSIVESCELANSFFDLVLLQNNESTYVQYQHWRGNEIDTDIITKLHVEMEAEKIKHGIVITAGIFSPEAVEFVLGKKLLLINGVDLSQMIEVLMQSNLEEQEDTTENSKTTTEQELPEVEPLCPICNEKMIKRTAKKGRNAGNIFWGCSKFPSCRGVVSG